MKSLFFTLCVILAGCAQGSDSQEKSLNDEKNHSISPNQVISKEEQMKKDSTNNRNLFSKDTTLQQGN